MPDSFERRVHGHEAVPMRVRPAAFIGIILASVATVGAADEPPVRSGWYVAAGLGAGWARDQAQEGWNRDTFCYPSDACFGQDPVPMAPGYRWHYDIALDRGAAFEVSAGRFFGRTRLELAFAQRKNAVRPTFTGSAYLDGTAIEPRPGGTVDSNGRGTIDHQMARSLSLDAYYDYPGAWGAVSPYVGAGIGQARAEIAGLSFSSDYRDTSDASEAYDPPLSFYNAVQNVDLGDTVLVWRLHAGADYALNRRTSVGVRLTWSASGDMEDTGAYRTHPMHGTDPAFGNTNAFSGARHWALMVAFRRGVGN